MTCLKLAHSSLVCLYPEQRLVGPKLKIAPCYFAYQDLAAANPSPVLQHKGSATFTTLTDSTGLATPVQGWHGEGYCC